MADARPKPDAPPSPTPSPKLDIALPPIEKEPGIITSFLNTVDILLVEPPEKR